MKIKRKQVWEETLRGIGRKRSVQRHEIIFDQGDALTVIGLVISGSAKAVFLLRMDKKHGLKNLVPVIFFGHEAILSWVIK